MSVRIEVDVPDPHPACPLCTQAFTNRLGYAMHYLDAHRDVSEAVYSDPAHPNQALSDWRTP